MFNEVNKYIIIGAAAVSLALASCTDKDKKNAEELYTLSEQAVEARNYAGALVILDTLDSRYRSQTEIRRGGMRLRAMAMEGIALDSIAAGDSALAAATARLENIRPSFRHVESSVGLEGYFLPQKVNEKMMTATGIQPRVSDKGYMYIVANVQGRRIGLNSIEFSDGSQGVSSAKISPARLIVVEGSESASFNPEEITELAPWLAEHPGANKIILHGTKGNANVKLDGAMRKQLLECAEFSAALQAQRRASIKREKYERMLATARNQLANSPQASQE
ncbi:MAG: hypothetical protein K2I69_03345 [Muribaculaceae bacterium]|nr:hypothetical protein [Muribaculaceae bacterium]